MSMLGVFIIAGDLLVSAIIVGLAAWLFCGGGKKAMDEAARIPLDDEDE
ncbi:MAG: CcoQ/FixQ family Cbb3-type cytochrome c oxidase assembly chaperone [Gammaproteobacteria bacterium]